VIGSIIKHFDIRLNVTCPAVRLEAVPKQTGLLGVYRFDINISLDIVGVWWRNSLRKFTLEKWTTYWQLILIDDRLVMYFL
jgi:hypothetical protein